MIDQYTISAIIGFWRSGASIDQIVLLTGLIHFQVWQVIYERSVVVAEYDEELKAIVIE